MNKVQVVKLDYEKGLKIAR